jgi:hypothetical protein
MVIVLLEVGNLYYAVAAREPEVKKKPTERNGPFYRRRRARLDLNQRPLAPQANALSAELRAQAREALYFQRTVISIPHQRANVKHYQQLGRKVPSMPRKRSRAAFQRGTAYPSTRSEKWQAA